MEHFLLSDLVSKEILQQLQNAFTKYSGISALILDANDNPITVGDVFSEQCFYLMEKIYSNEKKSDNASPEADLTLQSGKLAIYSCPAGLTVYAAPILVDNELTGILICGPMRTEDLSEETLRKIAADYELDPEAYVSAAPQKLDEAELERTIQFLSEIASLISMIAADKYQTLRQKQLVEHSARTQSDYLQRFSGDLKQNLSDLADFLESVRNSAKAKTPDDNMSIAHAAVLASNTMTLGSMLDETIDVMQIEGGNFELKEAVYDIRQLLEHKLNEFRLKANEKKNIVTYTITDRVPRQLMGDSSRVSTILGKFIENSLTYTFSDSIHVEIDCEKQGYATLLKIRITDNGVGIEEEQMHNILDYIMSRGRSPVKNDEFEDLGFALIGYAVNAMYGKVDAESKLGEGTTFTVIIPQLTAS